MKRNDNDKLTKKHQPNGNTFGSDIISLAFSNQDTSGRRTGGYCVASEWFQIGQKSLKMKSLC